MPIKSSLTLALAAAVIAGAAAAQQPPLPNPKTRPAPAPAAAPAARAQDGAAPPASDMALSDLPPSVVGNDDAVPARNLAPVPGVAGPYLAARQAAGSNDFEAAARYFGELVAIDSSDPYLQDSALVSMISAGRTDEAAALAKRLVEAGNATELAALVQRVELARQQDWAGVLKLMDERPATEVGGGDLLDGMFRGWALMGAGRASDAFATFEQLGKVRGAGTMARFQLALARASVGDYEGAERELSDPEVSSHLLGITARAEVLSQLERNADALAMIGDLTGVDSEPGLVDLRRRLEAGERLPLTVIRTPADGIAQVLLTFAGALSGGQDVEPLALLYARLAQHLAPDMADARLIVAQLLQSTGQFDLAEREFTALREMGDMRPAAELARIDALARADRMGDAEAAARALTETHPDLAAGWVALGDLLRQTDRFAEAVPFYDRALAILQAEADPQASWFALYARGIALERSGQYDRADADFQAALKLQPENAPILNYLGYSWVDRNVRLDEALKLIEKAVELRPDDGYILDSLGWAYYRLGRFDEAVGPMERAVAAMSDDSLVNDHMGDVYWMVGRKREAEIQWSRAQSLYKPEDTDTDLNRIRAKIEVGLDRVLEAERANGGVLPEGFGLPEPVEAEAEENSAKADEPAADETDEGANGDADSDGNGRGGSADPKRP